MPCSFISRCKGDIWWLEKQSVKSGRQHYPKMIKVGKLDHERVYLPEKTCHYQLISDDGDYRCSVCGYQANYYEYLPEPGEHCKGCGAKVEHK